MLVIKYYVTETYKGKFGFGTTYSVQKQTLVLVGDFFNVILSIIMA